MFAPVLVDKTPGFVASRKTVTLCADNFNRYINSLYIPLFSQFPSLPTILILMKVTFTISSLSRFVSCYLSGHKNTSTLSFRYSW